MSNLGKLGDVRTNSATVILAQVTVPAQDLEGIRVTIQGRPSPHVAAARNAKLASVSCTIVVNVIQGEECFPVLAAATAESSVVVENLLLDPFFGVLAPFPLLFRRRGLLGGNVTRLTAIGKTVTSLRIVIRVLFGFENTAINAILRSHKSIVTES